MTENTAEKMERDARCAAEDGRDGNAVGDDRELLRATTSQQAGEGEDSCTGVQEEGTAGGHAREGGARNEGLGRAGALGSFAQRGEGYVIVSEGTAVSASDVTGFLDGSEVTASGGFGDF